MPHTFAALNPKGIALTPSGTLLVTCKDTHSVYAIDPLTGHTELVAGKKREYEPSLPLTATGATATFNSPSAVLLSPTERCLWLADEWHHAVRRITLPSHFFVAAPNPKK